MELGKILGQLTGTSTGTSSAGTPNTTRQVEPAATRARRGIENRTFLTRLEAEPGVKSLIGILAKEDRGLRALYANNLGFTVATVDDMSRLVLTKSGFKTATEGDFGVTIGSFDRTRITESIDPAAVRRAIDQLVSKAQAYPTKGFAVFQGSVAYHTNDPSM